MKKIVRNMSTDESKVFWETAQRHASELDGWPDWKRAGINVAQARTAPRPPVTVPMADAENNEQNGRAQD